MAAFELILALSAFVAVSAQVVDLNTSHYTCATNYVPTVIPSFYTTPNVTCAPDPCYGNPGPCGTGGKCTIVPVLVSRGATFFQTVCQCQKPAVLYGPPAGNPNNQFCFVNGTDPCKPGPCKHNGTCESYISGGGVGYDCRCQGSWQGSTCELSAPSPPAQRKSGGFSSFREIAPLVMFASVLVGTVTILT